MKKTVRMYFNGMTLAISSLMSAQTPSDTQMSVHVPLNPFGNALIPDMIADASIQQIGEMFYCYATTDGYGRGLETSGPPVVWKSHDFVHWSFDGICFPSARNEKYWAPSKVVKVDEKYYIYPTINGYMYSAVADKPDGPFRLARGNDEFGKPYTSSILLYGNKPDGIDAEIFIDDDGQPFVFWGRCHVAHLTEDMTSIKGDIKTIPTPRNVYSEGPIFFKRNGIYYYLYTIGGDECYQYAYLMSRISPFGPYEIPKNDIIATTDYEKGVFGPGHGCVFKTDDSDRYYFAFLEFGRRSTNRQTYVNELDFNDDGTIKPVAVTLDGVGYLKDSNKPKRFNISRMTASSHQSPMDIKHMKDPRCKRTEHFVPQYAADNSNGSRWMAADNDSVCWLMADLGHSVNIASSDIYFVRPTAGHAYILEGSNDGKTWKKCGGHDDVILKSPHTDKCLGCFRYVRLKITAGEKGVWEWALYPKK